MPMFKDMHQQDSLELLCVLLDSVRTEEIGALDAGVAAALFTLSHILPLLMQGCHSLVN